MPKVRDRRRCCRSDRSLLPGCSLLVSRETYRVLIRQHEARNSLTLQPAAVCPSSGQASRAGSGAASTPSLRQ